MNQLASSLLVAILASVLTHLLANRQRLNQNSYTSTAQEQSKRIDRTIELWEEQESSKMIALRRKARAITRKCFEQDTPIGYDKLLNSSDQTNHDVIHEFIHFYERVAVLFDSGLLDESLFMKTLARTSKYSCERIIFPFIKYSRENNGKERHWMEPLEVFYRQINEYPKMTHYSRLH